MDEGAMGLGVGHERNERPLGLWSSAHAGKLPPLTIARRHRYELLRVRMAFSLRKLMLGVTIACIVVAAVSFVLRQPSTRIQLAGADYVTYLKSGECVIIEPNSRFGDRQFATVARAIEDLSTVSGLRKSRR